MRFILLLLLTFNLLSAEKIALLIGNSQYEHLERLSSPSKDIPALAKKLRGMSFKVTELYDLDEKKMKKSIKGFKKELLKSPNAIALFYYSGHGSQAYGDSYLIPIDGDTRDEGDVESDGVKVENIANKMAKAGTKANILFLDACRDVPTGTRGGTKGLEQVNRQPSATLILYSTSKNKTAKDDRVFNQTVLEKLALNMPFSSLANDISYAVSQKTSRKQVPELLSTGLPSIYLNGIYNKKVEKKIVKFEDIINELEMIKYSTHTIKAAKGFTRFAKLLHREKLLNEFIKKVDIFVNSFSHIDYSLLNFYAYNLSENTKDTTSSSIQLNKFREKIILDYKDRLDSLVFKFTEIKGCSKITSVLLRNYTVAQKKSKNNIYLALHQTYIDCLNLVNDKKGKEK